MIRTLIVAAFAFTLTGAPGMAETKKVDIVTKVIPSNVAGQFLLRTVQLLNAGQTDFEFRIQTVPGAAGEAAYQKALLAKQPGANPAILFGPQTFFSNPKTNQQDRTKDFVFLSSLSVSVPGLIVHRDLPVASIDDLVAYIRSRAVTYYAGSINSNGGGPLLTQIFLDRFKLHDKVKVVLYKGVSDRIRALTQKEADFTFNNPASFNILDNSGDLKIVALAAPQRLAGYDDVPTGKEQGFDEFTYGAVNLFALVKGDPELTDRLEPLFRQVCSDPEIQRQVAQRRHAPLCIGRGAIGELIANEKQRLTDLNVELSDD